MKMNYRWTLATILAAVLGLFVTGSARAQESGLETGVLVRVTGDSSQVVGHVWFVRDGTLVVQTPRRDSVWIPLETIRRLEGATYGDGPNYLNFIGVGVGLGAAALFAFALDFSEASDPLGAAMGGGIVGGVVGAVVAMARAGPKGWEEIDIPQVGVGPTWPDDGTQRR